MALGDDVGSDRRPSRGELDLVRPTRGALQEFDRLPWRTEPSRDPESGRELNLLLYWSVVWKHRLLVLGCLIVAVAIGVAATLLSTPIYTATTTIQIDREAAKIVQMQDVAPQEGSGGAEFYQTQYGLLKSRSLAARVAESLSLDRSPAFLRAAGLSESGADAPGVVKDDVVSAVQSGVAITPVRGSRLVEVSFSSREPGVSAQIANSLVENFIAANLERRFESSAYARDFLEKRIAQVKSKLEESERELVAYAARQEIISVQQAGSPDGPGQSLDSANLAALNAEMVKARAERINAEQRWRQTQVTTALALPEVLQSPTVQQLSRRRAEQAAEYQDQLKVYKPDFPAMQQLGAQIQETDRQLAAEAANIRESLRARYSTALNQELALAGQVEKLKGAVLDLKDRSINYNILQRELDTSRSLYDGLLQRYKEIGVTGGVTTNNISVVDRADPPGAPAQPKPLVNMGLALFIGLAAGLGGAFLIEAFDQAIRHPTDVESKLGLPLLGAIPILARGMTSFEAMRDARSPFWEAYQSVRTALQLSTAAGIPGTILITSARPSEGKSTTALALAQSLARLGFRTLLVDADLRKPTIHVALALDGATGLSTFLTRQLTLAQVAQPTGLPTLAVVASGPPPPNPAELLASNRLKTFIAEAEEAFDVVVIDGPPVMGLADAPMVSSIVRGTILVLEAGKTGRGQAAAAIRRLRMARARLLGAVLTKFDAKKHQAGYGKAFEYEYNYDYGSRPALPRAG